MSVSLIINTESFPSDVCTVPTIPVKDLSKESLDSLKNEDGTFPFISAVTFDVKKKEITHIITDSKIAECVGTYPRHGNAKCPFKGYVADFTTYLFAPDTFFFTTPQDSRKLRKILTDHIRHIFDYYFPRSPMFAISLLTNAWKGRELIDFTKDIPQLLGSVRAKVLLGFEGDLNNLAYYTQRIMDSEIYTLSKNMAWRSLASIIQSLIYQVQERLKFSGHGKNPSWIRDMLNSQYSIDTIVRNYAFLLVAYEKETQQLFINVLKELCANQRLYHKCSGRLMLSKEQLGQEYLELLACFDPLIEDALKRTMPAKFTRVLQTDCVLNLDKNSYALKKGETVEYLPLNSKKNLYFGTGAHKCPLEDYVKTEIKLILATLITKYDFRLYNDSQLQIRPVNKIKEPWEDPKPLPVVPETSGCSIQ